MKTIVYFTKILENNKKIKYNLFALIIVQFLRRKINDKYTVLQIKSILYNLIIKN